MAVDVLVVIWWCDFITSENVSIWRYAGQPCECRWNSRHQRNRLLAISTENEKLTILVEFSFSFGFFSLLMRRVDVMLLSDCVHVERARPTMYNVKTDWQCGCPVRRMENDTANTKKAKNEQWVEEEIEKKQISYDLFVSSFMWWFMRHKSVCKLGTVTFDEILCLATWTGADVALSQSPISEIVDGETGERFGPCSVTFVKIVQNKREKQSISAFYF